MRMKWKRWIAGLLTAVMLVTMLPTTALAALWENSASHNREILAALEELCGSEDGARYYYDLLDEYGLLEEDGDLFTNWSGVITIQEDSTPLTIAEVRAMTEGNVTVNGRACSVTSLNAALDQMEALGLLAGNAPVPDWQLQVDGQGVAPAELAAALDSWTAPEGPEEETPAEPESSEETELETPELPQGGGAGDPEQSGGLLASIGRFFGVGASTQTPAAPVVTVLGRSVDSGAVLDAVAFLEQYNLLTDTGCAVDWDLTLPGGDREIMADELLDMVESGELADSAVVNVDGIPVTVADLKVMIEIEEYIAYLRETYFDGHEWTQEQLDNLEDLVDQINNEGIEFLPPNNMEELSKIPDEDWPSGIRHDVIATVDVPEVSFELPHSTSSNFGHECKYYTITVTLNKPQLKDVTFDYRFYGGSINVVDQDEGPTSVEGHAVIPAGETKTELTVELVRNSYSTIVGNGFFTFFMSNLKNAVLPDGSTGFEQTISRVVDTYLGEGDFNDYPIQDFYPTDIFQTKARTFCVPEGEYTVGQAIPITISGWWPYGFIIKRAPDDYCNYPTPTITCWTEGNPDNKQVLTPLEASTGDEAYGSIMTYWYIVQPGDSGSLQIEGNPTPAVTYNYHPYSELGFPGSLLPAKRDGEIKTIAEGGTIEDLLRVQITLPSDYAKTAAKAKVVPADTRTKAFSDFSMQLNEGREGLTNPQMTASVTFSDNPEYTEWLLSAAIQNPDGEGFVTAPEQLGFSFDGGETIYSFPIPSDAEGDPIQDFTGVTLTTTMDLPLLNVPPARWFEDPGYPAAADKLWVAELFVDGEPVYGYADADTQRGIRFLDGSMGEDEPDFEADFEFVHTYSGQPWTEEEYRNIEFTSTGIAWNEAVPWFTVDLPTLTIQNTELKFNISTENAKDTDKVPLSFGDTNNRTGFQLDGEGGYVSSQGETRPSCPYVPLDPDADFGILSRMPTTAQVGENGDITYLAPGMNTFMVYATNGMVDDMKAMNDIGGGVWDQDEYGVTSPSFFDQIPLPEFPAPTQEEWAQTCEALGMEEPMPAAPTSWDEFVSILWESGSGLVSQPDGPIENYGDLAAALNFDGLLYISMGSEPFLKLPNPAMQATSGQDVSVYWSSNLCELNKTGETVFTVTVTKGDDTVYTTTATGTKDAPASSVTIPADKLKYDYGADASNQYTVTVSVSYQEQEYTATGTIDLAAKPATVKLDTLSSYYITDATSSVEIGWDLTDYGALSESSGSEGSTQQFELLITRGSEEVKKIKEPGTAYGDGNSNYRGSYTLNVADVQIDDSDPTSFRDVYTVTVRAMAGNNGTWSNDSFLLYVYDQDALDILIGGESVKDYKLSNRDEISKMSQTDILALNRDIQLKEVISTNYGERAWNALADQIIWKSSDSSVASINYPQGSYYDNIENYTYVSYRPTTDFGILGRDNGQTTFTATHKVTGISDSVPVTVETLENKLYLFQFYPQAETTILYTNGDGQQKTAKSDENGAAAIYEESGITGNVYCSSKDASGKEYRGTLYAETLKSGEGDWTKLEQYPCNNLNLRRTAYAYLYLKQPNGEPYTGTVSFRGGVYVNDEYVKEGDSGLFFLNGSQTPQHGDEGVSVDLSKTNGKLTVEMDQTLWNNRIKNGDQVSYIFELIAMDGKSENQKYYPIFTVVDASANQDAYVSSGEAIVNFQENPAKDDAKHPFIATQIAILGSGVSNVMDYTGYVGINEDLPSSMLSMAVMWWDDEGTPEHSLQLTTSDGRKIAANEGDYAIETTTYPFTSHPVTNYTVYLNENTVDRILGVGEATGVTLKYYTDGKMVRSEEMPYRLGNLRGAGKAEDSQALLDEIQNMGHYMDSSANFESMEELFTVDEYVGKALEFLSDEEYTKADDKAFQLQLAPTSDPTKFMGFISVNLGTMNDSEQVTGVYGEAATGNADFDYTPGFRELMVLAGEKTPLQYGGDILGEFLNAKNKRGINSYDWGLSGYMEAMIYYDFEYMEWKAQILSGGFSAGGGINRTYTINQSIFYIPFTASFNFGATAEVGMDALAVSYYNETKDEYGIGNDFLTQLRLYAYMKFFAGIGFDYSVVAAKVGVFGQVNLDMIFQWLNRPYMKSNDTIINVADGTVNKEGFYNLDGQSFTGTGTAGLEVLFKLLFISYEKVLWSYSYDVLDEQTGEWHKIQTNWNLNSEANRKVVDGMVKNGSLSVYSVGGQQMVDLNLAPALEDRSYLDNGGRSWGPGFSLFSLDPEEKQGLKNLESNTYPYANPVVTDDGELVAYLHDNGSSNVEDTVVKYATKSGDSYTNQGAIPAPSDSEASYGDSQLSLAGTGNMAVAAWARQTVDIQKDAGQVLTADEQMMMLNGTEVYASVYAGGKWTTTRLTENSTADMAPVVASNGETAVVAWRAVSASSLENGVSFDQRDNILYKVYNGESWSETKTLYNGTSGAVKGIVADMMADGTAAVAYALDTDLDDTTSTDREIAYAVIDSKNGEVTRTIQATKDSYLDENPQLTSVKFGDEERFVLGWYTEQAVASDDAAALDGGESEASDVTQSDIRLMEFGADGTTSQLLPDSMDQIASDYDVNITSTFRFTKNSDTIDDLSILWVERAEEVTTNEGESTALLVQRDVLKGVKFYTHGAEQQISFTAAVDVAEMGDGTLIDHFDAYVSNPDTNEIKAVILGTTYDANHPETKVAQTVGGDTVAIQVPSKTTAMYTATETYTDKIEVPSFLPDYNTVRLNASTQIQFTVENKGIHAINQIDIQVGDQITSHELDTPLLPGDSIQLYADYSVGDKVTDPDYKVTATFDQATGATGSAETGGSEGVLFGLGAKDGLNVVSGTIYLDLPDVEIVQAKVMSEEEGQRTIQIGLNNHSDAVLAGSGRSVRLSFFTDAACQAPIDESVLQTIVIDQDADLAELDEGGYSRQISFNVGDFVKDEDGTVQEIPAGGVTIYIKAEVLDTETDSQGNPVVQGEPTAQDNFASVTCDNLKERTGKDVIIKSDITVEGNTATVTVDLQNTRLTETTTGNLLVTMLDANGNVVGYQQSYDPEASNKGLITLSGEGKAETRTFTFDNMDQYPNATFQVQYSDLVMEEESGEVSTELGSLHCEGLLADMNDVKWTQTETGYEATVTSTGVTATAITAAAKSPEAKVSISGAEGTDGVAYGTAQLNAGTGTITITVSNGGESSTYVLNVEGTSTPGTGPVQVTGVSLSQTTMDLTAGSTSQLTATVEPFNATNKNVTWSSSAPEVAAVDENGKVTALTAGSATITVTTADGSKTAVCTVTVEGGSTPIVNVESVSLNKTSLELEAGDSEQLTATVEPENATNKSVTWTSNNDSVATVDNNGTVTAHKAGTATITVTTMDGGNTATCALTVTSSGGSGSGGSGSPSYAVDTDADTDHGTVTVKPSRAEKGDTVTITAKPDEGYQVGEITVTRPNGDAVKVIDKGNGKYTFTMPNGKVNVDVTFVPEKQWTNPFVDVPGDAWYYDAVKYVNENGLMAGTSANTFAPDLTTTRGMIVTILYRLEGSPDIENEIWGYPFKDVDANAYYATAVYWARMNGIVAGYSDELFGPDDIITREQMATILYRYAQYKGYDTTAKADLSKYTDAAQVGSYAVDAIRWANAEGLVNGTSNTTLTPQGGATRSQAAAILMRFCENVAK